MVRRTTIIILLLALAGCAAPREQLPRLPREAAPPVAREAPPAAAHREAPAEAAEDPEIDLVALRLRLHEAASHGHRPLTYDEVWTALEWTDEDLDNPAHVILLYTGRSHPRPTRTAHPEPGHAEQPIVESRACLAAQPRPAR